jgi:hypothetical protein
MSMADDRGGVLARRLPGADDLDTVIGLEGDPLGDRGQG